MSVQATLSVLAEKINENPKGIAGFQAVYQFHLSGEDGGTYQVKFADDQVSFHQGTLDEPKCILEMSDANFIKLVKGELNPTSAFMMGKLKVKGDLSLSLKLQSILQKYQ
jgi:putative sterol carrier protein